MIAAHPARPPRGTLAALVCLGLALPVEAHEFLPGVLFLVERTPGSYDLAWTDALDPGGASAGVRVIFPPPCRRAGEKLECGPDGLRGTLSFIGLRSRHMQIAVAIQGLDGRVREALLDGDNPNFEVLSPPRSGVLLAWSALGFSHVAGGADHIAFVLGLVLLVGLKNPQSLLATVTAFTLAHSLSLGLAALEIVRLPRAPVEASIALSVLLVAREALLRQDTLSVRAPWFAALLFGLVHGLGFAGALADLGLPPRSVGRALLGFNLGVEVGQLGVISLAAVLSKVLHRLDLPESQVRGLRGAGCYLLGALGAWWLFARLAAVVG